MSTIPCPPLPLETARAAESVFGREHAYIRLGNALNAIWGELELSTLEAAGQFLANSFHPYSLATIFQYWEDLTDRRMAQATRTRLDLKYALHLPIHFPGIEALRLCSFREHILASPAGSRMLQALADRLADFAPSQKSSTLVNQMLPAVCLPSRAEIVLECMAAALEAVATSNPGWLKLHTPAHWYRRYAPSSYHRKTPQAAGEIRRLMQAVGGDGWNLLQAIEESRTSALAQLPEIVALRGEWQRQFQGGKDSPLFREFCCLVCSNSTLSTIDRITDEEEGTTEEMNGPLHDAQGPIQ